MALLNVTAFHKKILNVLTIIVHYDVFHVWDTDSNKSFDFLLNPICIMFVFLIIVLFCSYVLYK